MKIEIFINTKNAAFACDPEREIKSIIDTIDFTQPGCRTLIDIYGDIVGSVEIDPE